MANIIKNPLSIILGAGGLEKYNIVQTIDGDTCTIDIVDFNGQTENNYLIGSTLSNNTQKLYIVNE